jgi:hypothetical protein
MGPGGARSRSRRPSAQQQFIYVPRLPARLHREGDRTAGDVAARRFMASDPVIVAGAMTATLHPLSLTLLRGQR